MGRGGYAEVFKGKLYNGQSVAVKRLTKENRDENKEREFLTELGIVGHVCHQNTVFLIGCCIENGLHLIFDFSPNGTLASALHGESFFNNITTSHYHDRNLWIEKFLTVFR